jgi:hypothetical protein
MRERADVPFAFLQDLLDLATEPDDAGPLGPTDVALAGSKAAMLDATADVLAALRRLLEATEEAVRVRRDRLIGEQEEASVSAPESEQSRRERVDITY